MSIYGTAWEIRVPVYLEAPNAERFGLADHDDQQRSVLDEEAEGDGGLGPLKSATWVRVWCQSVPPHIDYSGEIWDWLPPPVPETCEYPRAMVLVLDWTPKGTSRNGQEFVNPLKIYSWEEFKEAAPYLPWTLTELVEAEVARLIAAPAPEAEG